MLVQCIMGAQQRGLQPGHVVRAKRVGLADLWIVRMQRCPVLLPVSYSPDPCADGLLAGRDALARPGMPHELAAWSARASLEYPPSPTPSLSTPRPTRGALPPLKRAPLGSFETHRSAGQGRRRWLLRSSQPCLLTPRCIGQCRVRCGVRIGGPGTRHRAVFQRGRC